MMIGFAIFMRFKKSQFFCGKCTGTPRSTDATFQIADIAQFQIQKHQWPRILSPGLIRDHVFESIQGVHAFAGTSGSFFFPALSTGLWFFSLQEFTP
jgi:hypothetical protein